MRNLDVTIGQRVVSVRNLINGLFLYLTYQCAHKTAPQYLQPELVSPYNPPPSLRSSSLCRLSVYGIGEDTNKQTNKNVRKQGHSAILHLPSVSDCQTSFAKQKTLLFFAGN